MAHSDIYILLNLVTWIFFFFLKIFMFFELFYILGTFYFILERFYFIWYKTCYIFNSFLNFVLYNVLILKKFKFYKFNYKYSHIKKIKQKNYEIFQRNF